MLIFVIEKSGSQKIRTFALFSNLFIQLCNQERYAYTFLLIFM